MCYIRAQSEFMCIGNLKPKRWVCFQCAAVTGLGVGVVHSVAVQLEELHGLRLLLSVAAHGKCVLAHLYQLQKQVLLTQQRTKALLGKLI